MIFSKNRNSVVLWGGYGWGNVGDELTLAVAINELRQRGVDKISILTPSPGYTRALFPDLDVIPFRPRGDKGRGRRFIERSCRIFGGLTLPEPRMCPDKQKSGEGNWADAIEAADCLFLVGGGYFSSLFPIFSRFLLPVEVAKACGTTVVTAPLGIGPIDNRKLIKKFVSAFQGVTLCVRDVESADFCREHGLDVITKVDDGFRVGSILPINSWRGPKPNGIELGVNYFRQHGVTDQSSYFNWWREFLRIVVDNGVSVQGFCFHNRIFDDFDAMVELFDSAGLPPGSVKPPFLDFRDACRHLASYSMIASSRFHAAVVANAAAIPCLGVSDGVYYNAKMGAACEGSDKAHHIAISRSSPFSAFDLLMKTREKAPF